MSEHLDDEISIDDLVSGLCLATREELESVSEERRRDLFENLNVVPADPVDDLLSALDRAETMEDVRRALSDYESPKFPNVETCLSLYRDALRRTENRPV